jgi:hypothetical protein
MDFHRFQVIFAGKQLDFVWIRYVFCAVSVIFPLEIVRRAYCLRRFVNFRQAVEAGQLADSL